MGLSSLSMQEIHDLNKELEAYSNKSSVKYLQYSGLHAIIKDMIRATELGGFNEGSQESGKRATWIQRPSIEDSIREQVIKIDTQLEGINLEAQYDTNLEQCIVNFEELQALTRKNQIHLSSELIEQLQKINSALKILRQLKDEKITPADFYREAENFASQFKGSNLAKKVTDFAKECFKASKFLDLTFETEKKLAGKSREEKWVLKLYVPKVSRDQLDKVLYRLPTYKLIPKSYRDNFTKMMVGANFMFRVMESEPESLLMIIEEYLNLPINLDVVDLFSPGIMLAINFEDLFRYSGFYCEKKLICRFYPAFMKLEFQLREYFLHALIRELRFALADWPLMCALLINPNLETILSHLIPVK